VDKKIDQQIGRYSLKAQTEKDLRLFDDLTKHAKEVGKASAPLELELAILSIKIGWDFARLQSRFSGNMDAWKTWAKKNFPAAHHSADLRITIALNFRYDKEYLQFLNSINLPLTQSERVTVPIEKQLKAQGFKSVAELEEAYSQRMRPAAGTNGSAATNGSTDRYNVKEHTRATPIKTGAFVKEIKTKIIDEMLDSLISDLNANLEQLKFCVKKVPVSNWDAAKRSKIQSLVSNMVERVNAEE
jgi:hypothetical protein